MGYTTDFDGKIVISPKLPDEFVGGFNFTTKKRNNTYGDGEQGSFDHLYHSRWGYNSLGDPPPEGTTNRLGGWFSPYVFERPGDYPTRIDEYARIGIHRASAVTEVPSCWNHWQLGQGVDDFTVLEWDGGEKFSEYIEWMKYVLRLIHSDFPQSHFVGTIDWEGEDPTDRGQIIVGENKFEEQQISVKRALTVETQYGPEEVIGKIG